MSRLRTPKFYEVLRPAIVMACVVLPAVAQAESWMLMGHEGGCVSLADAARRNAVFVGITGPEDLARRLRAEGHDVTLQEVGTAADRAVTLDAPGAGLSIIFAPPHLCRK